MINNETTLVAVGINLPSFARRYIGLTVGLWCRSLLFIHRIRSKREICCRLKLWCMTKLLLLALFIHLTSYRMENFLLFFLLVTRYFHHSPQSPHIAFGWKFCCSVEGNDESSRYHIEWIFMRMFSWSSLEHEPLQSRLLHSSKRSLSHLWSGFADKKNFHSNSRLRKVANILWNCSLRETSITSLSSRGHVMLAQNFSWSKTTYRKLQKLLNDDKSATYLFFHKLNKTWRILETRNFLITATKVNPSTISEDLWTFYVSLLKFFPLLLRSTHNYKQVEQIF